ncbi:MAG TPA: hypothetical protein VII12_11895 [Thermoanaerobaculia bacterium]
MHVWRRFTFLAVILASTSLLGQEPPPPQQQPPTPAPQPAQPAPQPPPAPEPTPAPQPEPPVLSRTASGAYERRDSLPYFNLYLPEGQASIRLRKLIKNVLFESQIDYRFVNGDISTYLRYKYYSRNYTYKIGVFDTIGFPDIGSRSTQEFQRVRGGLLLTEFPRDYNHRYFWLVQDDRLTFGDVTVVDNRKNNIYTKFGYQYGTQFDEHLNSIVGESRGRIIPVLTAFRELGPQKTSFSTALTESARFSTGDYRYTKLEGEVLRRWDVTPTSFVVTRAHLGVFPTKSTIRTWCADATNQVCGTGTPPPGAIQVPQIERYSIPSYELFDIGGREALKSISSKDASAGTSEFHVTNEYFLPIFRNRDYKTFIMHWNTLYGIGYLGAGNVGYRFTDAARVHDYIVDAGLGTEASITIRDFDVLLSIVYAHTVRGPQELKGSKWRVSIRTIR